MKIFSCRAVWALFVCYYCNAWGFWLIFNWLPTLFKQRFGASLEDLGWLSVLPFVMQGVIGMAAGLCGDRVLLGSNAQKKKRFRLAAQAIAMLGATAALLLLLVANSRAKSVALVTAAMALNALSTVGIGVNHFDLAPRHAGFLFGLLNSVGVLPGVLGVPITGWILEATGNNWVPVIILTALHYVIGLAIWFCFGSFTVQVE
jgi:ACS family sodium-dependent inorganic phosphate cotransporter